jgi:hypothetical protein
MSAQYIKLLVIDGFPTYRGCFSRAWFYVRQMNSSLIFRISAVIFALIAIGWGLRLLYANAFASAMCGLNSPHCSDDRSYLRFLIDSLLTVEGAIFCAFLLLALGCRILARRKTNF